MLTFLTGASIVLLFACRPFVYKPASKSLDPAVSSYFTSVWCLILSLPTIPFCWQYFFIQDRFVFFTQGIIFPLLKGVSLYWFMKFNQIVNKENTSGSVFWGVISLALAALVTTFVFHVPLSNLRLLIILFIGSVGILFFICGEGKNLSLQGKKAFTGLILCAALNNICDTLSIKYTNWYVLYMVPTITMMLCSIINTGKKISLGSFFTTRHILYAGLIYAVGEIILIFSMQYFFPVLVAVFLVRFAQSLDLILAYHIEKEGKIGTQYLFATGTVFLSYFFFFGH